MDLEEYMKIVRNWVINIKKEKFQDLELIGYLVILVFMKVKMQKIINEIVEIILLLNFFKI
jgi:hypothetical protein